MVADSHIVMAQCPMRIFAIFTSSMDFISIHASFDVRPPGCMRQRNAGSLSED